MCLHLQRLAQKESCMKHLPKLLLAAFFPISAAGVSADDTCPAGNFERYLLLDEESCPPGYYLHAKILDAAACPAGYFKYADILDASSCPSGSFKYADVLETAGCPSGTFLHGGLIGTRKFFDSKGSYDQVCKWQ